MHFLNVKKIVVNSRKILYILLLLILSIGLNIYLVQEIERKERFNTISQIQINKMGSLFDEIIYYGVYEGRTNNEKINICSRVVDSYNLPIPRNILNYMSINKEIMNAHFMLIYISCVFDIVMIKTEYFSTYDFNILCSPIYKLKKDGIISNKIIKNTMYIRLEEDNSNQKINEIKNNFIKIIDQSKYEDLEIWGNRLKPIYIKIMLEKYFPKYKNLL